MKRAVVFILAVAIVGSLGYYGVIAKDDDNEGTGALTNGEPAAASFKDGTFTGDDAETPYGSVQVAVVIKSGKITDVKTIKMPKDDERSREITASASPALKANALKAQSSIIDFVSGATSTSYGYQQSLQAALDKASGSALFIDASRG